MFKIIEENFYGTQKIKLYNSSNGEYLSIIPSFGGNINELVLEKNNVLHEVLAGDLHIESLSGKTENLYRGAKLSPFPNRIANGQYTFNNTSYQFRANAKPHSLHGLLWNRCFLIQQKKVGDHYTLLKLTYRYKKEDTGYPFDYQIEIEYRLEQHAFTCHTTLTNFSDQKIPIADGWHPYLSTGTSIEEVNLSLPSSKYLVTDHTLIPTGEYMTLDVFKTPSLIQDNVLDHCFEIESKTGHVKTKLIHEKKDIALVLWQNSGEKGYNFVHVYTPKDRLSIAIEPVSCAPNGFNNGKGLIFLQPEESIKLSFGIVLE